MHLGLGRKVSHRASAGKRLLDVAQVIMACPPPGAGRGWAKGGRKLRYTAQDVAMVLGCSVPTVHRYWRESKIKTSDLAYMIRALKKGVK
ncbi:MAG: hypothetical protein M3Y08_18800 [Fibrobacterota bacterium]|nr:hypothetical protein [Fibrobacterota bacterium]